MNKNLASPNKILITYPYFLPAFKAGGPIQSIANLCRQLKNDYQFFIVCSNTDHNETTPLQGINSDEWNDFENGTASVYYLSKNALTAKKLLKIIEEVKPNYLFINGIFSPYFNLVPLFYSGSKKILSVRGMLHSGALTQKPFKKNIYLAFLKLIRLNKKVVFHATDNDELQFVKKTFGKDSKIIVAQNFSNFYLSSGPLFKHTGSLKLVSVALISPMKNHALVLQALKQITCNVEYDIYGPVKEEGYWQQCQQIINTLPQNITVNYKGSLQPAMVRQVLSNYHYFVLPSKSENFGHAIFEALTLGKPVITSNNTPWKNLQQNFAGYNVAINNTAELVECIKKACHQNNDEYQVWSNQASIFAQKNIDLDKIKKQYQLLFN